MIEKGTEYVNFQSIESEYQNAVKRAKDYHTARLQSRKKIVTNIVEEKQPPKSPGGLIQGHLIIEWQREIDSIEEGKKIDTEADYQEGIELMQKKCYTSASKLFEKHLQYKDSSDLLNKCLEKDKLSHEKFWKKDKAHTRIIAVVIIAFLILFIVLIVHTAKDTSKPDGEVYCQWCGKIIYNDGKPYHCKDLGGGYYECEYCGKSNYIG